MKRSGDGTSLLTCYGVLKILSITSFVSVFFSNLQMRDQYIKSYSRGILTCLIQHKENTADVPDGILALLE
jgi:hypothetical protein